MDESRDRFGLYRLCECPECEGTGKIGDGVWVPAQKAPYEKCPECRGEGRIRQEVASCETAEAVGVALVTLGREREWEGCALGLLERGAACAECWGTGTILGETCATCKGSGVKPTGDWILLPWLPSARNVRDAARTLARHKGTLQSDR